MREEDYTFVTLDSDDMLLSDAVVVDVEEGGELQDAVMIDENDLDTTDFITLSDDTVFMSDADMLDMDSMDLANSDIAFLV